MVTTWGSGITAAAGTGITHPFLAKYFALRHSHSINHGTWDSLITLSHIVKVPQLLHPVGLGALSQSPSPGYHSHGPY